MVSQVTYAFNVGNNGLVFGDDEVACVIADSFNPTTGTGQAGPIGSLFLYAGGTLFIKTGPTNTAWSAVGTSSSTSILAGLGLYFTGGNTLNVSTVNPSRITVSNSGVDLANTGIAGGTYTKITMDQYGRGVIGGSLTGLDVANALGFIPAMENGYSTALYNTNTTGIYVVTGPISSATRQIVVPPGLAIANPDGVGGNPTISLTSELLAVESMTTLGLTVRQSPGQWSTAQIIVPPGMAIANPDGVAGNPTISLTGELAAAQSLSTFGIISRTAAGLWDTISITGTPNQTVITNGNGVISNPTISLADNVILPGTGALTLPIGNQSQQPSVPVAGMIRYDDTTTKYEGYDTAWFNFASESWVTNNTLAATPNLTALSNITGAGIYVLTGAGTSALRSIDSPNGTISVSDGNGFSGNIDLQISSTYAGQNSITTVGTVTNGTWKSTPIGTLYGGTGLTSIGAANQILGVDPTGTNLEYKTVTGGTGITVTPSNNLLTINNAGVTSITAGPGLSVGNSTGPVTINNTGVTSLTAGTGIILSNTSGPITISTYQLFAENPQPAVAVPTATGLNAVAIGQQAIAEADNSLAIGAQSYTRIPGSVVQANGRFATSGDAQAGRYILRANTVSNFPSEGFMDGQGGNIRLVLPDNATWTFRVLVTAQRTDQNDGRAGFEFKGIIYRTAGVDSVNIQGQVMSEQIASSNQSWGVIVDADQSNGSLRVQFVGENGKIIRWVALVETVEVTD
jgi:hypothetical protein